MYKQTVNLAPGEMLQLDWGKNYRDFSVYLNGQLLASVPDKATLKLGRNFSLPDGRQFTVLFSQHGLECWHNGTDLLSGLPSGFVDHYGIAVKFLFGYAILQLVFGGVAVAALATFGEEAWMVVLGVGIEALLFIGLGFWAKKTGAKAPLVIALIILAFEVISQVPGGVSFGIIILVIVIYTLVQGLRSGSVHKPAAPRPEQDGPLDAGM